VAAFQMPAIDPQIARLLKSIRLFSAKVQMETSPGSAVCKVDGTMRTVFCDQFANFVLKYCKEIG
jgi:hypothetical protein